jgi:hypothetical protein
MPCSQRYHVSAMLRRQEMIQNKENVQGSPGMDPSLLSLSDGFAQADKVPCYQFGLADLQLRLRIKYK